MCVIPLFICSDLKCKEYNDIYNVYRWIIFVALGHQWKFIYVKNKHVKYSHNLIWGCAAIGKVQHCKQQIGNCRDSCTVAVKTAT